MEERKEKILEAKTILFDALEKATLLLENNPEATKKLVEKIFKESELM